MKRSEEISNEIYEHKQAIERLDAELKTAIENEYAEIGVTPGTLVTTGKEQGIFVGIRKNWSKWEPEVMKLKKDGTAHSTAHLFIWDSNELKPV